MPLIRVPGGTISATQQASAQVASTTTGVRGTLSGAAGTESACDPIAAGAFAAMQSAWMRQAAHLAACDNGLAGALGVAAFAYPDNDDAQMQLVWEQG